MRMNSMLTVFLSVLYISLSLSNNRDYQHSTSDDIAEEDKWMLDLIPKNSYKRRVPPERDDNEPINITVKIGVSAITVVDENKMYFEADLNIKLEWVDDRLRPPANLTTVESLEPSIVDRLWYPQLIFRNCRGCELLHLNKPRNRFLLSNTTIRTSLKVSEKFFCHFNLRNYPMDKQECKVQLENAYDSLSEAILVQEPTHSDIMDENSLPQFDIVSIERGNCTLTSVNKEENSTEALGSCVELEIVMERLLQHHIMLTFIPSTLVVMISWISFWLHEESVPARTALGLTGLLTLTTQFSNVQRTLPPVSYIKAIDVWMLTCMFAVFASLIEFAIVNFSNRLRKANLVASSDMTKFGVSPGVKRNPQNVLEKPFTTQTSPVRTSNVILRDNFVRRRVTVIKRKNRKLHLDYHRFKQLVTFDLDKVARWLFPLIFVLFNFIYWIYYLHS